MSAVRCVVDVVNAESVAEFELLLRVSAAYLPYKINGKLENSKKATSVKKSEKVYVQSSVKGAGEYTVRVPEICLV